MNFIVCGDRHWDNYQILEFSLNELIKANSGNKITIIEGGCKGADLHAKRYAKEKGIDCWEFPALWDKYGKGAGPVRNAEMLKEGRPHLVIAFHHNLSESKGTLNMVRLALKTNVTVWLINDLNSTVIFRKIKELEDWIKV